MPTFYQKILIAAIVAAFCGDILIFYLKKLLVNTNAIFSFDLTGIMERIALICVIVSGGYFTFLIPLIVLIRALFLTEEGRMRRFSDIIKREEPALAFQKIRLKSELTVTLLASPALGILLGMIATFF